MDNNPNNTMMTVSVSLKLEDIGKFLEIAQEMGVSLELVSTKQYFDSVKFKHNAPQA